MPRNQKELPADVRFVRRLFGLKRKKPEAPTSRVVSTQLEKGVERITAQAEAQISGQVGQASGFRLKVTVAFEAHKLAELLGLNSDDATIQELGTLTTKQVDTTVPTNNQILAGADLMSNPQIKMDLGRQDTRKADDF